MEATPEFNYEIEDYPEPEQIGKIKVYISFVRPNDMEPILTRSNFSCSLPANEFIDDEDSPHKQILYYFLTDSGVDARDALKLIQKLVRLACEVTSSFVYRSHYALLLWLTLNVAPSSTEGSVLYDSQVESVLDDSQVEPFLDDSLVEEVIQASLDDSQVEEVIQASLDEYDERRNSEFRPASTLRVEALSRRIYKRKRKTSSIANQCTRYKRKQETWSSGDKCTICLMEFKSGREVATLHCGHEFDNKCIMEWFKVGRVNCPLCRFELPREDDEIPQILTTIF